MNDNSGFGGAVGLLVLLIAFGAMSNGNGGGLFGGGNNNIPAQTSAMVEQNRSAAQIAANGAALSNLLRGGVLFYQCGRVGCGITAAKETAVASAHGTKGDKQNKKSYCTAES